MKPDNDMAPFAFSDIPAALGLLTRLPLPVDGARAQRRGARAAWAYPVAGLAVGGLAVLLAWVGMAAGLPVGTVAALVLALQIVLTGALHEDGLADCADGFWGGWDRDRRLEIMKDSRIGAYGVLALVLASLLRWLGIVALLSVGSPLSLIAVAMLSRAGMLGVMAVLPPARDAGLSSAVGRPAGLAVVVAALIAAFGAMLTALPYFLWLIFSAAAASLACAAIARRKIGGQTGDVLGATQQIAEIAMLITLSAVLG